MSRPTLEELDREYYGEHMNNGGYGARERYNEESSAPPQEPPPLEILSAADFVAGYIPPSYIVDGILQRSRVYSLTGQTGHGKTAVALSLAVAIARGHEIAGRRVDPGRVVYLAAENPDDVRARMVLMTNRLDLQLDATPLHFVEGSFDLPKSLSLLAQRVDTIEGADLVVVDTGGAFLAAGGADDENNNMALLNFALALRSLTELPGHPAVLALMHPVKRAEKDNLLPRGGGAFLAEVDGNLIVWAEAEREFTDLHWAGKLRGPTFDPITFALECGTCSGLVDAEGRNVPSVWAYPTDAAKAETAVDRQRAEEDAILALMAHAPGSSFSDLARALGWLAPSGDPERWRVQRAVKRLADDRLAEKIRGKWRLTKAGKAEAGEE